MKVNTLQLNHNFDFELDADGMLPISLGNQSVLESSAFTISSNDDWIYREDLGMHWLDSKGNGLLQSKGNEEKVVYSIISKLNENPLITAVKLIEIKQNDDHNRKIEVKMSIIIDNEEEILEFSI